MADPYVPPDDPEERLIDIALDPWVTWSRYVLWLCGFVSLVVGLVGGPGSASTFLLDPAGADAFAVVMAVLITVLFLVIGVGIGALNFVAAAGLGRGARWGWALALGLGVVYLPTCCLPLGAVLVYGMLNDRTRKLFMG